MIEKIEAGRVPPGAAMLQQIAVVRQLLPWNARILAGPLLDTFAAYVAETEARLEALEQRK